MCAARSTDTKEPCKSIDHIDRNGRKAWICRHFVRSVFSTVIARVRNVIDRRSDVSPASQSTDRTIDRVEILYFAGLFDS